MRRVVWVLCALVALASCANIANFFSTHQHGEGTYYDLAYYGAAHEGNGQCTLNNPPVPVIGKVWKSVALQDFYVSGAPHTCGMCIELIGGTGDGANPVGGPHIVVVTDICDTCPGSGDIDIAWAGKDGRWDLEWRAVTCPSSMGNLRQGHPR